MKLGPRPNKKPQQPKQKAHRPGELRRRDRNRRGERKQKERRQDGALQPKPERAGSDFAQSCGNGTQLRELTLANTWELLRITRRTRIICEFRENVWRDRFCS